MMNQTNAVAAKRTTWGNESFHILCPYRVTAIVHWESDIDCVKAESVIDMILRQLFEEDGVLLTEVTKANPQARELNLLLALRSAETFQEKYLGKSFSAEMPMQLHVTFESFVDTLNDEPRLDAFDASLNTSADCVMMEVPFFWVFLLSGVEKSTDHIMDLPNGTWHAWFSLFGAVKHIATSTYLMKDSNDPTCHLLVQFEDSSNVVKCARALYGRILVNSQSTEPQCFTLSKIKVGSIDEFTSRALSRKELFQKQEAERTNAKMVLVMHDVNEACEHVDLLTKWDPNETASEAGGLVGGEPTNTKSTLCRLLMQWIESAITNGVINAALTLQAQNGRKNKTPEDEFRIRCWTRGLEFIFRWVSCTDETDPDRETCMPIVDRLQWDDISIRFAKDIFQGEEMEKFRKCISSMISSRKTQEEEMFQHAEQDALKAEEELLRELELDEPDKKPKKKKNAKKKKKVKTDADEEEDDFQESIRRAPSPTRSPTVRSGKRMMCATPSPFDDMNDMTVTHHLLDAELEAGLGVGHDMLLDSATASLSLEEASHISSSTNEEEDVSVCHQPALIADHTVHTPSLIADQAMSCVLRADIKSTGDYGAVEQGGDGTRTAQMVDEELYKIAQTIVANLIEPFSGRDVSVDADETEKVLTISTPATPAALQIGIGMESTPTSPKKKKKKNKRKKNPHVLEVNVGTDAASDDSGCECEPEEEFTPLHKSSTKKSPKKSLHQQKTAASLAAKTPTSVTSAAGNSMLSSPTKSAFRGTPSPTKRSKFPAFHSDHVPLGTPLPPKTPLGNTTPSGNINTNTNTNTEPYTPTSTSFRHANTPKGYTVGAAVPKNFSRQRWSEEMCELLSEEKDMLEAMNRECERDHDMYNNNNNSTTPKFSQGRGGSGATPKSTTAGHYRETYDRERSSSFFKGATYKAKTPTSGGDKGGKGGGGTPTGTTNWADAGTGGKSDWYNTPTNGSRGGKNGYEWVERSSATYGSSGKSAHTSGGKYWTEKGSGKGNNGYGTSKDYHKGSGKSSGAYWERSDVVASRNRAAAAAEQAESYGGEWKERKTWDSEEDHSTTRSYGKSKGWNSRGTSEWVPSSGISSSSPNHDNHDKWVWSEMPPQGVGKHTTPRSSEWATVTTKPSVAAVATHMGAPFAGPKRTMQEAQQIENQRRVSESSDKAGAATTTTTTRSSTPTVLIDRKPIEHKHVEPIQIDVYGGGEKEQMLLTGLLMRHPEQKKQTTVASYRESLRKSGEKRLMHLSTNNNNTPSGGAGGAQRNDSESRPPPLIRSVTMPASTVSGRNSQTNSKYYREHDDSGSSPTTQTTNTHNVGGMSGGRVNTSGFSNNHSATANAGGYNATAPNTPSYYNSRHNQHQTYQSQNSSSLDHYGTPSADQYQSRSVPTVTDQYPGTTITTDHHHEAQFSPLATGTTAGLNNMTPQHGCQDLVFTPQHGATNTNAHAGGPQQTSMGVYTTQNMHTANMHQLASPTSSVDCTNDMCASMLNASATTPSTFNTSMGSTLSSTLSSSFSAAVQHEGFLDRMSTPNQSSRHPSLNTFMTGDELASALREASMNCYYED